VPELFRFALVALVCFTGPAASAMGVRKDSTLLARSDDGAALFEVREHGPEGGGALTYRAAGPSGSRRRSANSGSPPSAPSSPAATSPA